MDNPAGTIVIVDDNPNNLRVLGSMLQQANYKIRPALDGQLALKSILANPPDLILLDIRMPGMDGYQVCHELKNNEISKEIPVIFISALQDTEDKLMAFKSGGVDYITKPFQLEEVLARVKAHLSLYRIQRDLQVIVENKTSALMETLESLKVSQQKYRCILHQTIHAVAVTLEKRDPYTAGHQMRVSEIAVAIAEEMQQTPDFIEGLRLGGMVHDIGKIYVPVEILNRPGQFTELELALVRTHPEVGYEILKNIEFPWPVAEMVRQHHERMDGHGYPRGLKDGEILLEARILAVADVIEAIASHRPYRPAKGIDAALDEISSGTGTHYDERAVAACLRLIKDKGYKIPEQIN